MAFHRHLGDTADTAVSATRRPRNTVPYSGTLTRGVARVHSLHRALPRPALRAVATVSDSLPSGNCVPNTANMIVPRDYITKGEA